jgi:hypothetical protein
MGIVAACTTYMKTTVMPKQSPIESPIRKTRV